MRQGAGNLKSLIVFGVFRVAALDSVAFTLPANQDLPSLIALGAGIGKTALQAGLGVACGLVCMGWALSSREFREPGELGNNLLGGVSVGLIIVAVWWVSGHLGYVAEDPETL